MIVSEQAAAEIVGGLFEQWWATFTDAELPVFTVEFGCPEPLCGEPENQTYAQFKTKLLADRRSQIGKVLGGISRQEECRVL